MPRSNAGGSSRRKLEFTAKLSEAAFALETRFALGGILTPNLGDHTPHGRANLKIMKGLVALIDRHRDDVAGFDPERPLEFLGVPDTVAAPWNN